MVEYKNGTIKANKFWGLKSISSYLVLNAQVLTQQRVEQK